MCGPTKHTPHEPIKTLSYYNPTLLFTAKPYTLIRLAILAKNTPDHTHSDASTPSDAILANVEANRLSLFDTFQIQPCLSILQTPTSLHIENTDSLPVADLPNPGVYLHP